MTNLIEAATVVAFGNGATTVWPFTFYVASAADLDVRTVLIATGVATPLTGGQYSSVLNGEAGGSITYPLSGSPLASTHKIIITRIKSYKQELDLASGINLVALENQLDYLSMQIQQLQEMSNRAIRVPLGDVQPELGNAVGRANKIVTTNAQGKVEAVLAMNSQVPATEIPISPITYGAIGDGVADDRAALAAADAAAIALGAPLVITKVHRIASDLTFTAGSNVIFEGGSIKPDSGVALGFSATAAVAKVSGKPAFDLTVAGSLRTTSTDLRGPALKISDYIPSNMSTAADAGFKAALKDLFNLTYYSLDLEGRKIVLDAPLDMATITGLTSKADWRRITNGKITPSSSFPAVSTVTKTTDCDMTAGSEVITNITSTADLLAWMEVSGTGIPRSTFVKSVDSSTQVTLTRKAMTTGANRTLVFKRHRFIFDFTGFTVLNRFTFDSLNFDLDELASGYLGSQADDIIEFRGCRIVRPETYGICQPDAGGGLVVDGCDFLTADSAVAPGSRTRIGIACNGDCRIINNRLAYFKHALIVRAGSAQVIGNHPFSGMSTASVHTAGMIFQQASRHTITGNYIDNGWLEFTNETFAYNPAADIGGATVVGNFFTVLASAATELFIVVAPYVANSSFRDLNISGNFFQPLLTGGAVALTKVTGYDATNGSVDNNTIESIFMQGNLFNNVTTRQENPATAKFQSLTPWGHTTGSASFTGKMPFDINPLGLAIGLVVKGANTVGAARVTGRSGGNIDLAWPTATAVDTDFIVTATCNQVDPLT